MYTTKLPKVISAEDLLSTPIPPTKWIIPGLLPAGLALFAGPSKAGKSWLTLWLCLQVAQGKPVWGREIEPHTVLYLSLEDTLNRLQDRLFRLVGSEDTPEKLILQTECLGIGQGLENQIVSFLYNNSDTGLVVIDREQPIFTDPDGHVPHPDTFTRHLRKMYKQCGLSEDYHLHTLRHFYATYLLQEGTSKQVAASLLGHADTAFLERTYCHPQDVAKQQAAKLMQDLLNNQNPCYVAFMKNRNRKPKKAG